jgi:hypothetical protein
MDEIVDNSSYLQGNCGVNTRIDKEYKKDKMNY